MESGLQVDQIAKAMALLTRSPLEISINDACIELGISESLGLIGRALALFDVVDRCNFEISPGIDEGDLYTPRVLRAKDTLGEATKSARAQIEGGEGQRCEFKSSLVFDHKRFSHAKKNDPGVSSQDISFRSDEVTHSSLKTIAAFLNSDGGTLLVGVDDSGEIVGINWDFHFVGATATKNGPDKWELHLKNLIKTRFKDGARVADYVSIAIFELDGLLLATITVTARRRLSFLKEKGGEQFLCYTRTGNSTAIVDITEMEKFIVRRSEGVLAT
jgi:hypothetical protein